MPKEKTVSAPLRLTEKEKKDLKKEAKDEMRSLASYLKFLIMTHPSRQ